jgi:periplasmic protein TonB
MHRVEPVDPSQAKAAHIVGNVILEVHTDRNGYVEDVTVVQGHPSLIQSAIEAVRQWRYVPVVLRGETVPVVITVVVPFGSK